MYLLVCLFFVANVTRASLPSHHKDKDTFNRWLQDQHELLRSNLTFLGSKNLSFRVAPFSLPAPIFVSDKDKSFIWDKTVYQKFWPTKNDDELLFDDDRYTEVKVYTLTDTCWEKMPLFACGAGNTEQELFANTKPARTSEKVHDHVVVAYAPQSEFFQHFKDGAAPKLALVSNLTQNPDVTVYVSRGTTSKSSTQAHLQRLGIPKSRQIEGRACGKKLTIACNVPPLHPLLFDLIRKWYRVPTVSIPACNRTLIIHATRNTCKHRNAGRGINQEDELLKMMNRSLHEYDSAREELGLDPLELRLFCSDDFSSLDEMFALLSHTIGVTGPHGSALLNIMEVPSDGYGFMIEIGSPVHNNFIFQVLAPLYHLELSFVLADRADSMKNLDVDVAKFMWSFEGALSRLHDKLVGSL